MPADDAPPSSLPNLGPASDRMLREIGIHTAAQLRGLGSVEAWLRLRFVLGRAVTLNALDALDGAISGHDWRRLPAGRKAELRRMIRTAE